MGPRRRIAELALFTLEIALFQTIRAAILNAADCQSLQELALLAHARLGGKFTGGVDGHQHVFLAHHQVRCIQAGEFETVSVRDRVRWAGLDAIAAEDAAVVVDVVNLGIALGAGDTLFGGVLVRFDVDAVRRAGCGAEKAGDALFQSIFVALENVRAAEPLLKHGASRRAGTVRIILHLGRLKHLPESNAHSFADGGDVAHDGHVCSIRGLAVQANAPSAHLYDGLDKLRRFAMRSLCRSVLVVWVMVLGGLPLSAQESLKVQNGSQQTSVSLDALKALPHKTVTIHNPHENADETYSGVALLDLLKQVGAPTGKDVHGKALAGYVVATGSDGYKAVLALAEVEPDFHPGDVLVADTMNGKPLDAKFGPFRLVVSDDKRPARSVRNLVSVELKAAE